MARFGAGTMMAVVFAILIGLGGAYAVRHLLTAPADEPEPDKAVEMVSVPIVAYDIPVGRMITRNDLIPTQMTREAFNRSRFAKQSLFMNDVEQIIGRRARVAIPLGDTVAIASLWPDGMGPGIEDLLKPGQLAKPLPINSNDPVLSYIGPGSMVDVYFTTTRGGVTVSLLERVEVLDVAKITVPVRTRRPLGVTFDDNQRRQNEPTITRVQKVTVAVSDYQAKALAMVEGQGEMRLALRKKSDFSSVANAKASEARMTIGRLLHDPVGLQRKGMQIYRGSAQQNLIFSQKLLYDERLQIQTPVPEQPPAPKAKAASGS